VIGTYFKPTPLCLSTQGRSVTQENGKGLTAELCAAPAAYCRQLIPTTDNERVKIMLQHIALTWERIAERLNENN
jgi:hypothetical protein